MTSTPDPLAPTDTFVRRHLGPSEEDIAAMCATLGVLDLDELTERTVPASIRVRQPLAIGPEKSEHVFLRELAELAGKNRVLRSFLGMGYHGALLPSVLQRTVLENPGWYTQYTPYQAEISQGRLEALLNYQTMVADLTGFELANASLLDEGTAAAEALCMCHRLLNGKRPRFFIADDCHPQTIAVCRTRLEALGLELEVGPLDAFDPTGRDDLAAVLLQYPATNGTVADHEALIASLREAGALVVVATDLLALTLLRPPAEFGADVAVGSTQRFGVPLGYGGPHAAFLATHGRHKRQVPGRIIGVSRDARGEPALRMSMQTREQHIRREKATSNICTAQVLLAILAGFYGAYHGPDGLRVIARRVHRAASVLAAAARAAGFRVRGDVFFDTVAIDLGQVTAASVLELALARGINLRQLGEHEVGIALDETVERADLEALIATFAEAAGRSLDAAALLASEPAAMPAALARQSTFMTHPVFHRYHSEHEMLRYVKRLEARDLSLTTSMIPLGSCTMKLNAATEMFPITWPTFANLHPFVPLDQAEGYAELFRRLEAALCDITGFHAVTLQPNAGSQGEYAGMLVIRAWHRSRGDEDRDVCLIPVSAHGTNPASATLAGLRVVTVACDHEGNIDLADLRAKASQHAAHLAAVMVTYPSTHGVFEEGIREVCEVVHEHGGQVYLDGANMNAQVGLCRPGDYGADVCHLNLHKTFCIPHGGGGPGVGPIGVAEHLAPFLPGHPLVTTGGSQAVGAVASAPWGSASILPISWAYIALMGSAGLKRASQVAILNANYMAERLREHYPILYRGKRGTVAHEFIMDLRPFEKSAGVTGEDVAKRLADYGFHAPTMSFPVAGTLMIEPTESESRAELDRLCDALIAIRAEIRDVAEGRLDRTDNPLANAPHTAAVVCADEWPHSYSRERAAFPAPWTREHKFWPSVGRVDNGFGDRNLICSCPPVEAYAEELQPRPSPARATPTGVSS